MWYLSGISLTQEEKRRFAAANTSEKQSILQADFAKSGEYLSMCGEITDCNNIITEEIANQTSTICDSECRTIKEKIIRKFNLTAAAIDKMYDKNINKTSDIVIMLSRTSMFLTVLGQSAQEWKQATHTGRVQYEMLKKKIQKAEEDGVLDRKFAKNLRIRTKSALAIDPEAAGTYSADSLNNVIASVNKAIRENQESQIKDLTGLKKAKEQAKNYGKTTIRELTSMSKTDALSKGANALGGVALAVSKFQSADGDALKIISGVLDLTNSITQFMPPPASLVTESISGIFNLFAGGPPDPSNQQVIDEVKNTIDRGFAHQRNFLEKKFAEHMILIKDEFQKLESVLKDEFQKLADELKQGFESMELKITEGFESQRYYIKETFTEDHLRKVKNDALAQLEAVEEKLIFIMEYKDVKVTIDVANSIDRQIAALSNTRYSALSKTTFEDICRGVLDDNYGVSKSIRRKYCATLLYTYLIVEQDRSIVLSQLMAVLKKTPLEKSNEGYLEVYNHRRSEVVAFLNETVLEKDMGCSLFNPAAGAPVLTTNQITEISTYMKSLSNTFIGSIEAFQNKGDCPRKYLQILYNLDYKPKTVLSEYLKGI